MQQRFTHLFAFLAILVCSLQTYAQSGSDEQSKVTHLLDLANAYKFTEFEKARGNIDEALAIATRINFKDGMALSYWRKGQLLYNNGQLQESKEMLERAAQAYRQLENKEKYAYVMKDLCDYYVATGDEAKAETIIMEALNLAKQSNNAILQADCEISAGIVDMKVGAFAEATAHYLAALRIGEQSKNDEVIMNSCRELGNINSLQSNLPLSNSYFNKALGINKKLGNKLGMADAYCNIGSNYLSLGNYNEALSNIELSMQLSRELNYKPTLATDLLNMGYALIYSGNAAAAESKLEEAENLYLELSDQQGQSEVLNAKGFMFSKAKDFDKASAYYMAAADIAERIKANNILKNSCEGLAYVYERKGDFEAAYHYQKRGQELAAQMFSGDNAKMVTQLQLNYEFDKQQEQQRIQQKLKDEVMAEERKASRLTIIGLILFFLMAAIIALVAVKAYRATRQSKMLLQEKNELITQQKEKAERILSEIIPIEIEEKLQASNAQQIEQYGTAMFVDFKDFTKTEEQFSPIDLMDELDIIFKNLDDISKKFSLETLKTLSDGYLCIAGLNSGGRSNSEDVLHAAMKVQQFMNDLKAKRLSEGKPYFEMKIGVHTGLITGGIVGVRTLAADIWGESVQTASLIEKMSRGGEIKISESTYDAVKDKFETMPAGEVKCGKQMIQVYQLIGPKDELSSLKVSHDVQGLLEQL